MDRPRPGEFGVIECRIMTGCSGEFRERHNQKYKVPQRGRHDGAARNAPLDPAIFEKTASQKILRNGRSAQKNSQAAADPLVETSPAEIQLRPFPCAELYRRGRFGSLPEKIECIAGLVQRHDPPDYTRHPHASAWGKRGARHLQIDEARPPEVYSAGLDSSSAALPRR